MCKRTLTEKEYKQWLITYEQAERDVNHRDRLIFESYHHMEMQMELVGATGIEDRLQEGVPETIESLRKAGIVVWVLTGDKQETALNIAYSCKLFSSTMDIIKLNARNKDTAEETINFYLEQAEKMKDTMDGKNDTNHCMEGHIGDGESVRINLSQASEPHRGSTVSELMYPLKSKERALVVDGRTLT